MGKMKRSDSSDKVNENSYAVKAKVLFANSLDASVCYENKYSLSPWLSLILPALTYGLILLNIGLDKAGLGYIKAGSVVLFAFLGLLFGIAIVFINSLGIYFSGRLPKKKLKFNFEHILRGLGKSYFIPLIISLLGIIFNLSVGWSVSTFGLCAMLFSLCPLTMITSKLYKKNLLIAYGLPVITGIIQILFCHIFMSIKF